MNHVFTSFDSVEVGLRQSVLKAAGIACDIRGNALSQVAALTELWIIHDRDFEEAMRLLSKAESGRDCAQQASLGSVPEWSGDMIYYAIVEVLAVLLFFLVVGYYQWFKPTH